MNVLMLVSCSVTAESLPRAKFTIRVPLSFVSLCRLCSPHAGYKWDSFPALALQSPITVFMRYLGTTSGTFSKELCISYLAVSYLSSVWACVDVSGRL